MAQRRHLARRSRSSGSSVAVWQKLMPWPLAAVIGGVATAAVGWLLCTAFALVGWLSATGQPLSAPLGLASALFLLANGATVTVAGVVISIPPLLLTFAIVACGLGLVRVSLRRAFNEAPPPSGKFVAQVAGVMALAYGLVTAGLAGATGQRPLSALVGGLVVGFITTWWAVAPLCSWQVPWPDAAPAWVKALPRAVGAGLGVLGAGGALVMAVALIVAHHRVADLQAGLAAGPFGSGLLAVAQLFWVPTMAVWGVAWMVGAGVSLGVGTVVTPVAVELGMLPSVPVFGAVPAVGSPSKALLCWFVVPLLAGVVAAWVALRAQATADALAGDDPSIDGGALAGGATGIVTGFIATGMAALTRGDLGQVRLVGLGPLAGNMALLAPLMLGFSGAVAGLAIAWHRALAPGVRPIGITPKPPKPPPQPWRAGAVPSDQTRAISDATRHQPSRGRNHHVA